jgi:hypothetical protein
VGEGSLLGEVVESTIINQVGQGLGNAIFSHLRVLDYGRAPYEQGWSDEIRGIKLWAGGKIPHFTAEHSGKGMAYLRENLIETEYLSKVCPLLSRIDVAVDIETDQTPDEFVSQRIGGKQSNEARFSGQSGLTRYIGSPHSERYMRVYRYNAPHPRSHLLRVETVFRRAYAKSVGTSILAHGLENVASQALTDFGFDGAVDFKESVEPLKLTPYPAERNGGKTLRWLITQVAPAFKSLVRDGTIPDAEKFLWAYFMPIGDNDDDFALEPVTDE